MKKNLTIIVKEIKKQQKTHKDEVNYLSKSTNKQQSRIKKRTCTRNNMALLALSVYFDQYLSRKCDGS